MGSSTAPKMFSSGSAFGQSQGNAVTQAQPLTTVPYQGTPDLSAYTQQQANPATTDTTNPDLLAGAGSPQSQMQQFRQNRQGSMPFYGMMS